MESFGYLSATSLKRTRYLKHDAMTLAFDRHLSPCRDLEVPGLDAGLRYSCVVGGATRGHRDRLPGPFSASPRHLVFQRHSIVI